MNRRENLVVVGTGMKHSGKSQLLWDRYVKLQPRVIHLDANDEVHEKVKGCIRVMGLPALYRALDAAHRRNARAFNIALTGFSPGDVVSLLRALVPPEGPNNSLARAFGTLALECGEMGMLCQIDGKVSDALSIAIMNARHHGLSLFLATQYPYSLPVASRMNSDEVFFFQQDEPQALVWTRQVVGTVGAQVVSELRDHAFLLYDRGDGMLYQCDKHRRVIRALQKTLKVIGAPLTPAPLPRSAPVAALPDHRES